MQISDIQVDSFWRLRTLIIRYSLLASFQHKFQTWNNLNGFWILVCESQEWRLVQFYILACNQRGNTAISFKQTHREREYKYLKNLVPPYISGVTVRLITPSPRLSCDHCFCVCPDPVTYVCFNSCRVFWTRTRKSNQCSRKKVTYWFLPLPGTSKKNLLPRCSIACIRASQRNKISINTIANCKLSQLAINTRVLHWQISVCPYCSRPYLSVLNTSAHGLTAAWVSFKYAFCRDITAIKLGIPPDDTKGTGKNI